MQGANNKIIENYESYGFQRFNQKTYRSCIKKYKKHTITYKKHTTMN
jgi:hypothetical protein